MPLQENISLVDGRFAIEHQVGSGATATVYKGFDVASGEPVALKVWLRAAESYDENPAEREAKILERIEHESVIRVLSRGVVDGKNQPYLALEWLDGGDLSMRHVENALTPEQVICVGILLCRGLAAAHAAGIIHRDIKPQNILFRVVPTGNEWVQRLGAVPVLCDFGFAKPDQVDELGGTPAYMAPEQVRGDSRIDERTDLYSLGATLFELLVGRPPHLGATPLSTLARLATTSAPRLSVFRPDLSNRLDAAIAELLATDPSDRPPNAASAEALLRRSLEEELSLPGIFEEVEQTSLRGTSRLVTTLVAMGFASTTAQSETIAQLKAMQCETVRLGGTAIVAHFGVERATGGEAQAALQVARQLSDQGLCVGVASGRARLITARSSRRAQPIGDVVDRAASLAREARKSEILADATTSELGRGRYEFRVREDGSAYVGEVLHGRGHERTGGAPFVGREAELSQILGAFERARAESLGTIICVTGTPGIGKSRLMREAVARLSSLGDPPRVVVQRSDAFATKQALGAAADVLRALLGLRKGASLADAERALLDGLGPETLSEVAQENRGRLTRLLVSSGFSEDSSEPLATRDHLWVAMTDLVSKVLSNETVLLVTEDLQWADGESVAFFDHLLSRATKRPLVILSCIRPAFWQENEHRFASRNLLRLDLRPIARKSVCAIAESVLGAKANPKDIELIAEQAGGSPLFAEELARILASGRSAVSAPTIEAAIQVSLDALDEVEQDAVRRLSVLGLATWTEALEALGVVEPDAVMRRLTSREILVQQSTSRFATTSEYLFKHALVRDVAYSSLASEEKSLLHAAAGRWLASVGEDAATVAGQLDLGGDAKLAAEYWERAARRALVANALSDALGMAERALLEADEPEVAFRRAALLDDAHSRLDPRAADRETAISAMLENAFDEATKLIAEGAAARYDDAKGGASDVDDRLTNVRTRAKELGLTDEIAKCSACLAQRRAFSGDFEEAEMEAQRLLELSGTEVRGLRVDAYQTLAIIRQTRGMVTSALDARKNAVQAAREVGLREREATLTINLGFALSTVGARTEAREAIERGMFIAETIGSPAALRHGQMNLLGWASVYGSDKRIDAAIGETRSEADDAASGNWAAPDRSNLGVLYYRGIELLRSPTEAGRSRALSLLKLAAESYRTLGHRDVLPVALGMWAEAERLNKNPERTVELGAEAVELLRRGAPSLLNETPVYLALFKGLMELGREDEAHRALEESVGPLLRRLQGLANSPYAGRFLAELPYNAELVATLESSGLLPEAVHRLLEHQANVS